ncbi:MAG: hypothetical protein DHS20C02_16130 [Micavibrio sp.]|nr:MAG: hypothetical protein DHS20C02_16130 [Micavibrio sp.]
MTLVTPEVKYSPLKRPGTTPNVSAMHAYSENEIKRLDIPDMGQGNPLQMMPAALLKLIKWWGKSGNKYHDKYSLKGNEAAARFLTAFGGLKNADKNNTLLLQQPGRFMLAAAFKASADPYRDFDKKPIFIVPDKMWGVINIIFRGCGIKLVTYDVLDPNPAKAIQKTIEEKVPEKDRDMVCGVYMCSPNNPTGALYTADDFAANSEYVMQFNAKRKAAGLPGIVTVVDAPYINACPHNAAGSSHILQTGWDGVFGPAMILNSFSKQFEMCAEGGGAAHIADLSLMDAFRTQASVFGGLSYGNNFMEKMANAMHPKNDEAWQEFFLSIHDLYRDNLVETRQLFGDRAAKSLGSNMTGLVQVSGKVVGKEGEYFDSSKHLIKCGDDFIEFLHNRIEGVTCVYDGMTPDGDFDIRIANKNPIEIHRTGLLRIKDGERELIGPAPALAAA